MKSIFDTLVASEPVQAIASKQTPSPALCMATGLDGLAGHFSYLIPKTSALWNEVSKHVPFTTTKVHAALAKLKTNWLFGPDLISAEIL